MILGFFLSLAVIIVHRISPHSSHFFSATDSIVNDADAEFAKYAYVIVTYHKSGHALSHTLVKDLQSNFDYLLGYKLRAGKSVRPRRDYNAVTKCTELSLEPGTVTLIEGPDFHCSEEELAGLLISNPNPKQEKRGVKLVHLVRNPFTMAVSNYHYHSMDPAPEPGDRTTRHPCISTTEKPIGDSADVVADVTTPVLSRVTDGGQQPIMTRDDFDNIAKDCYAMYQTRPDLADASYYDHLRALPHEEGLRMATADRFNNFALMASDMIMFRRVQDLLRRRRTSGQDFDLMTMNLDDWIAHPDPSMRKFLDFVFGDRISKSRVKNLSRSYQKRFVNKSLKSQHITSGKYLDTDKLIQYLREDGVFGGPLSRMESLLHEVLRSEMTDDEAKVQDLKDMISRAEQE